MGRHEQALDLLVGVVGEGEDDPVRLGAALFGADLDAPDDAVGTRRGRDLQAVTLAGEPLHHRSEVDGRAVQRHPHGLYGTSGPERGKAEQRDGDQNEGTTHGTWRGWD